MQPKIRHKKAAHRLYILLWLSNCVLFDDADSKELTKICKTLYAVCYPEYKSKIVARGFNKMLEDFRKESNALLAKRNHPLTIKTIKSWKKQTGYA